LVASFISGPTKRHRAGAPSLRYIAWFEAAERMRSRGYIVSEIGEGERIPSAAIFTGG
jgi:hypothetical protein